MNGYELAVLENIERVRIKLKRVVDESNYFEPVGYRKYAALVDLVNHQETLIQEIKQQGEALQ